MSKKASFFLLKAPRQNGRCPPISNVAVIYRMPADSAACFAWLVSAP